MTVQYATPLSLQSVTHGSSVRQFGYELLLLLKYSIYIRDITSEVISNTVNVHELSLRSRNSLEKV